MKGKAGRLPALAAALMVMALALALGGCRQGREEPKTSIRVGVLLYKGDDTFIGTLRAALEERAKEYEKETGIKVTLDVMDGKGSQTTQNNQVERLLSLECDVLCVNMVDRAAASVVIDKAMTADVPVIFFNREPVEEDMNRWEKLYYVGVDPREGAILQGQILADAYHETPSSLDSDGDGIVSYVLLEGESSHQDSLIRTEWSIQTLKDNGIPIERLTGGIANWERTQASALMEQWIAEYGREIEVVICNNDDMALGAIDALERNQMLTHRIRVVGIDGTPAGKEALAAGRLFGTVEADIEEYAGAIFDPASELAMGEKPAQEKYYWCSQYALVNQ